VAPHSLRPLTPVRRAALLLAPPSPPRSLAAAVGRPAPRPSPWLPPPLAGRWPRRPLAVPSLPGRRPSLPPVAAAGPCRAAPLPCWPLPSPSPAAAVPLLHSLPLHRRAPCRPARRYRRAVPSAVSPAGLIGSGKEGPPSRRGGRREG